MMKIADTLGIQIDVDDRGFIILRQWNESREADEVIEIHPRDIAQVVKWLRDAKMTGLLRIKDD